jgi:ATP-dependent DNA helicase RecQ
MKNIKKVLKDAFGFNSFKEGQEEIVKSIVSKNDTLVFMPTG